jgi:hypothetical protein
MGKKNPPTAVSQDKGSALSLSLLLGIAVPVVGFIVFNVSNAGGEGADNGPCDASHAAINQFFNKHGASFSSALQIENDPLLQHQRRVVASRDIRRGESLIKIPRSLFFTPDTKVQIGERGTRLLAFDDVDSTETIYRLAVRLLNERRGSSKFSPWLRCLPSYCPSLFCFGEKELQMLQSDAYAAEALQDRDVLRRVLRSIRASDWAGGVAPTEEEWLWAVGIVISRQFARATGDKKGKDRHSHIMLPFADMMNHNPLSGQEVVSSLVKPKKSGNNFSNKAKRPQRELIASRDLVKGEELELSYTKHSSSLSMLRVYGFVMADDFKSASAAYPFHYHNFVELGTDLSFSTPKDYSETLRLLRTVTSSPERVVEIGEVDGGVRVLQLVLRFLPEGIGDFGTEEDGGSSDKDGDGIEDVTMGLARIMNTPTKLASMALHKGWDFSSMVEPRNEEAALASVQQAVDTLSSEFKSTVEADIEELQGLLSSGEGGAEVVEGGDTGAGKEGVGRERLIHSLRFRVQRKRTMVATKEAVSRARLRLSEKGSANGAGGAAKRNPEKAEAEKKGEDGVAGAELDDDSAAPIQVDDSLFEDDDE